MHMIVSINIGRTLDLFKIKSVTCVTPSTLMMPQNVPDYMCRRVLEHFYDTILTI